MDVSVHSLVLLSLFIALTWGQKDRAQKFLEDYNRDHPAKYTRYAEAFWLHATNLTEHNKQQKIKAQAKMAEHMKLLREEARSIDLTDADDDTRRRFKLFLQTATSDNSSVLEAKNNVHADMTTVYYTATVPYDPKIIKSIKVEEGVTDMKLGKHLHAIMAASNDSQELLYVWKGWRDAVGPKVKGMYEEYVRLNNMGAREKGHTDAGAYDRMEWEVDNIDTIAEKFLEEMRPLYEELHGYVRYKLSKVYKEVTEDDLIPAHLLGNMWAQAWTQIERFLLPYPSEPTLDVTPNLKSKLKDAKGMFLEAERFFTSLGWRKLPAKFWTHSMFVEPEDRKVKCHASAWDFIAEDNGEPDVRVKMCTEMRQRDFKTVHHEMGHNYYQMLYSHQPLSYRDGANPGFHEAVGEVMRLSVQTPTHLNKVGLLTDISESRRGEINFLLRTALQDVAFLPFAYIMDRWMWDVYDGTITPQQYNTKWWQLRKKYQGIKPPVERTEDDFDPGTKMHIVADVSYIRYFFARIYQYTFHKHACRHARHEGPVHRCSIHGSKEAGDALGKLLGHGKDRPWPEILEEFTGSREIEADSIKEYFAPLTTWLKEYRGMEKYTLGWAA